MFVENLTGTGELSSTGAEKGNGLVPVINDEVNQNPGDGGCKGANFTWLKIGEM